VTAQQLRDLQRDAARWRWWQPRMLVASATTDEIATRWLHLQMIPYRSTACDPNELTDGLMERYPLEAECK